MKVQALKGGRDLVMANASAAVRIEPDLDRSPIARYLQLATLFRNWIIAGKWSVGDRIPNVAQLAENFGVARETIRQALDIIDDEGLIERKRGKGSIVLSAPSIRTHKLETDWNSIMSAHEGAAIEILGTELVRDLPGDWPDKSLHAPAYRYIRRIHARDGVPYLYGRAYIDARLYRLVKPSRFKREPTLRILKTIPELKIASAKQVLTIETADVEIANHLELPLNTPIARVRRSVFDPEGSLICASIGIYRGDAIRLEIELH